MIFDYELAGLPKPLSEVPTTKRFKSRSRKAPSPRKGTETDTLFLRSAKASSSQRPISPQGDGNIGVVTGVN